MHSVLHVHAHTQPEVLLTWLHSLECGFFILALGYTGELSKLICWFRIARYSYKNNLQFPFKDEVCLLSTVSQFSCSNICHLFINKYSLSSHCLQESVLWVVQEKIVANYPLFKEVYNPERKTG